MFKLNFYSFRVYYRRAKRLGFFFFNDTATTEIYTLSLHDALPISNGSRLSTKSLWAIRRIRVPSFVVGDRKSTRLNSSHSQISYAVFCLKKKYAWTRAQPLLHPTRLPTLRLRHLLLLLLRNVLYHL